jgi:hypothetical protein
MQGFLCVVILNVTMLGVIIFECSYYESCCSECFYPKCCYAKCHYAKRQYAKCSLTYILCFNIPTVPMHSEQPRAPEFTFFEWPSKIEQVAA